MDKELLIDFVFGDKYLDVKKMDYSLLNNFKMEVENIKFIKKPYYYQKGVLPLVKEDYKVYLVLGEVICVSTWLLLISLKFFKNKKIYLWSHGWYGREGAVKKILKKIFFGLSDGVFLYGNYAKNLMLEQGFKNDKLHIIYNSLSYDNQIKLRRELKQTDIYLKRFNNQFKNLIFVGRLTEEKRLDLLLSAVHSLIKQKYNFNIIFIGEGESKESLLEMVKTKEMGDNVWFYGACYEEEELSKLIYNADLCISPGNVGLTAIHSMMFGTPVVTHDDFRFQGPEFESIIPNETGDFFKRDNVDSLTETIKKWFNQSKSRDLIRKACYSIIDEKFNPHYQLKVFKDVFSEG
jgi:glycosyltransferase involved in cell wall biosynthesis